jgi:DNA end-binding protein Ku
MHFHMLHDEDKVRLRRQMVCVEEQEPVPPEEVVKGLDLGDGRYVLVSEVDLEELEPETDRTIEVDRFCDMADVDARYYNRPYHLGPDGEERKYASLARALSESGRQALCRYSFRNRSYQGAIQSVDGVLHLVTLRMAGEVAPVDTLDLPDAEPTDKERKTARYLVDELGAEFSPTQYHNDFREKMEELVRTKAEGGEIARREGKEIEPTEERELVDLLEASLAKVRERTKGQ